MMDIVECEACVYCRLAIGLISRYYMVGFTCTGMCMTICVSAYDHKDLVIPVGHWLNATVSCHGLARNRTGDPDDQLVSSDDNRPFYILSI